MRNLGVLYAFLGGAIVGCGAAIWFAPSKGSDLRERVCKILRRKGVKLNDSEVDQLVAELAGAIEK